MADPFPGMQKIGSLLFGGAGRLKTEAYEEGRLNTAKTEDALANARVNQMKATAGANAERAKEKWKADFIAIESTKPGANPAEVASRAEFIGNMLIGGTAGDFHSAMQGMGEQQEQGFRAGIADVNTPRDQAHAYGSAIQGKLLPRIAPVGTHGTENLIDEVPTLTAGPGSKTTAARNYEYSESLPSDAARRDFSPFVGADQIVNTGGVPTVRARTTGESAPVIPADDVASNAAKLAEGKKTGTTIAVQKADYPMVKYTLDQNRLGVSEQNKLIDELLSDEKLWQAVGPTQLISAIPGTQGAYIRGKLDTLGNKQMLQTLVNLRSMSKTGGAVGNVSDREGDTMRGAQGAVTNFNLMAGDMRRELMRVREYNNAFLANMDAAFTATYDDQGNPILSAGPRGAGGESVEGQESIEDLIINSGDGEYDDEGNLVRADGSGWTLETDAAGNKAWVSPDRTQFEEVAQ